MAMTWKQVTAHPGGFVPSGLGHKPDACSSPCSCQNQKREVNSLEQPQGEEMGAAKSAHLVSF